jgi:hypothetical protein
MRQIRELLCRLLVGLTFVTLSACATAPAVSSDQVAQIQAGTSSAIIMAYRRFHGYNDINVEFMNVDTGQTHRLVARVGKDTDRAGAGVVAVPPGRYRVVRGGLVSSSSTAELPMLAGWLSEFEVNGGEVVNIGTLRPRNIYVQARPGLDALLGLDSTTQMNYVAYDVDYSAEANVRNLLETRYPNLGVAPIQRPVRVVLDAARFEQIVNEAYSQRPDGSAPSIREARARLDAVIDDFVRRSRASTSAPPTP